MLDKEVAIRRFLIKCNFWITAKQQIPMKGFKAENQKP